ncbi:MAG: hypothetical protein MJ213_02805 [Bacilli bacterium]|nr:hypothetical protein [Bacilli bacterium]
MKKQMISKNELKKINELLEKQKEENYILFRNKVLNEIAIPYGTFGDIRNKDFPKGGYGIEHIIEGRHEKNNMDALLISKVLICVLEATKVGKIIKLTDFKCTLEYRGVRVVLVKDHRFSTNQWVLTGFPELKKGQLKKETIDFISSVSERYEYLPEFSHFQTLVVAIVSSIDIVREKLNKSNCNNRK